MNLKIIVIFYSAILSAVGVLALFLSIEILHEILETYGFKDDKQ